MEGNVSSSLHMIVSPLLTLSLSLHFFCNLVFVVLSVFIQGEKGNEMSKILFLLFHSLEHIRETFAGGNCSNREDKSSCCSFSKHILQGRRKERETEDENENKAEFMT